MNPLLDEVEKAKKPTKIFQRMALGTGILTIILIAALMSFIPSEMRPSDIGKPIFPIGLLAFALLSCVGGFAFSLLSFIKKEPSTVVKWLGGFINITIFVLSIWSVFHPFQL
jgi:hypothetical protein